MDVLSALCIIVLLVLSWGRGGPLLFMAGMLAALWLCLLPVSLRAVSKCGAATLVQGNALDLAEWFASSPQWDTSPGVPELRAQLCDVLQRDWWNTPPMDWADPDEGNPLAPLLERHDRLTGTEYWKAFRMFAALQTQIPGHARNTFQPLYLQCGRQLSQGQTLARMHVNAGGALEMDIEGSTVTIRTGGSD